MTTDTRYLKLYHEYSNAIHRFDIALRVRQRVRRQLNNRRAMPSLRLVLVIDSAIQPRHRAGFCLPDHPLCAGFTMSL